MWAFSNRGIWASHRGGFSCGGVWALGHVGPAAHRICCPHSVWDLSGSWVEPMFPALVGVFLTTVPPGKSKISVVNFHHHSSSWQC